MKAIFSKVMVSSKTFLYRLFITIQLYVENGLANHAAACAYGFLLSVAPMLLMIAFLVFYTFESSPGAISALLGTIPFLGSIFDEQWLSSDFLSFSGPGIPGLISVLSIIWAGRILAIAMQRGLKAVFQEEKVRSPVKKTLVTLAIQASAIVLVLMVIISSRTALRFFSLSYVFPGISALQFISSQLRVQVSSIALLGFASFLVYSFVPVNPPRRLSAFQSALFCTLAYFATVLLLGIILNKARYNFVYGTFGNLIVILVNVYIFFTFFYIGAQLAFVRDSFDALLFSRMRKIKLKASEKRRYMKFTNKLRPYTLLNNLFHPSKSNLGKYLRYYEKDEIIFSHADAADTATDVFYLLEGEIEILVSSSAGNETLAGVVKADSFFGEMGYLLSKNRTVTVRAKTDVSVLAMSVSLFNAILQYDSNIDRTFIRHLSRRLKNTSKVIEGAISL